MTVGAASESKRTGLLNGKFEPANFYAESVTSLPDQSSPLELDEFRKALEMLPTNQRESLILVGASGFSYEEAAKICGCAVDTIKSRVNRARSRLAAILSIESADHFGPDHEIRAVVGTATGTWRRS
jgi:RNA polymerase sigma-70 factor, ECF subfamily